MFATAAADTRCTLLVFGMRPSDCGKATHNTHISDRGTTVAAAAAAAAAAAVCSLQA
jgi:hypothetical protein